MASVFKYRANAGAEKFYSTDEVDISIEPACSAKKNLKKLLAYVNKYNKNKATSQSYSEFYKRSFEFFKD